MSKKKKKKGAIVLICILIIACILLYLIIVNCDKEESKVVDEISKYGYTLDDRDTKLMQDTFNELKKVLTDDIDYEKYAELLSKLFIIDLYTLDNKLNKYDVGGAEYIYGEHVGNFKLKVGDTLYKYLEDESNRKQKLPKVKSVEVKGIEPTEFEYQDTKYEGYNLEINWEYEKDLGYDKSAKITIFKVEDKLYIGEFTPEVNA